MYSKLLLWFATKMGFCMYLSKSRSIFMFVRYFCLNFDVILYCSSIIMFCSWYLTGVFKNSDRKTNFGPCPADETKTGKFYQLFQSSTNQSFTKKSTYQFFFQKVHFLLGILPIIIIKSWNKTSIIFLKIEMSLSHRLD